MCRPNRPPFAESTWDKENLTARLREARANLQAAEAAHEAAIALLKKNDIEAEMNIMFVSVTERTREIGLRKALGARPRVIRRQFLVEASVLGLAGGLLGALLGLVGSGVLPHFISSPVAMSPTATAGAIAIAIAIGLGFGVYPASRAARLAPIDALRTE